MFVVFILPPFTLEVQQTEQPLQQWPLTVQGHKGAWGNRVLKCLIGAARWALDFSEDGGGAFGVNKLGSWYSKGYLSALALQKGQA